jgi:hypothetical protein
LRESAFSKNKLRVPENLSARLAAKRQQGMRNSCAGEVQSFCHTQREIRERKTPTIAERYKRELPDVDKASSAFHSLCILPIRFHGYFSFNS